MELTIERDGEFDGDEAELRDTVTTRLSNVLQFTPDKLDIVDPGGIERTQVGKVQRVFDHR